VNAGHFSSGGDLRADGSGQTQERFVDSFAIARNPVTVAEYQSYLNAISVERPAQAIRDTPHGCARALGDGDMPVTGINLQAARAYCSWLSESLGAEYRLPTEFEWEKAARGADGRIYPWGNRFDANRCQMRYTRAGAPKRVTINCSDEDISVYGMRFSAGLVTEWTDSPFDGDPQAYVVRGGSFEEGADACRLARRHAFEIGKQRSDLGFRVVRQLPSGGGDVVRHSTIPSLLEDKPATKPNSHLILLKTDDDSTR
jgi:serine/threonine-protein kinase